MFVYEEYVLQLNEQVIESNIFNRFSLLEKTVIYPLPKLIVLEKSLLTLIYVSNMLYVSKNIHRNKSRKFYFIDLMYDMPQLPTFNKHVIHMIWQFIKCFSEIIILENFFLLLKALLGLWLTFRVVNERWSTKLIQSSWNGVPRHYSYL